MFTSSDSKLGRADRQYTCCGLVLIHGELASDRPAAVFHEVKKCAVVGKAVFLIAGTLKDRNIIHRCGDIFQFWQVLAFACIMTRAANQRTSLSQFEHMKFFSLE